MSVLSLQLVVCIQVLRHLGSRAGAGAGWAGTGAGDELAGETADEVVGAAHFVQMVDVLVMRIVDSDCVVVTIVWEPDVMVAVTGQVVTDVEMMTVVTLGCMGPGTLDVSTGDEELG